MLKSRERRPSSPIGNITELNDHSAPPTQAYEDPPDGGYGWLQVAVCFTVNGFTWGQVAVSDTALNGSAAYLTHQHSLMVYISLIISLPMSSLKLGLWITHSLEASISQWQCWWLLWLPWSPGSSGLGPQWPSEC